MPDDNKKPPFNWRDHIEIVDTWDEKESEKVAEILDHMFRDENGNGRVDNKYARRIADDLAEKYKDGKKLPIVINSPLHVQNGYDYEVDNISISTAPDESAYYFSLEEEKFIQFSLNRTIFHELVHASDKNINPLDGSEYQEESYAMEMANKYMRSEFDVPERSAYLMTKTPDENVEALIYQPGETYSDKEDITLEMTMDDIKDLNSALIDEITLNGDLDYDLAREIFIEERKEVAQSFFEQRFPDLVEKHGSYEEFILSEDFIDAMDEVLEANTQRYLDFNRDLQPIFNIMSRKLKIQEQQEEKTSDGKEQDESGASIDPNILKGLDNVDYEASSVADATSSSPTSTQINKQSSTEKTV